jgi:4-hydroxy-tetrahydrodipicolinate synthase
MRIVTKLTGFAPALPTPFAADGKIDLEAFAHLCRLQLREGATALVVCGTTGEAPTLSMDEQKRLIQVAANVAGGHIPVIAGAGSNSTDHAIELTRQAHAAGANAVLSVVPYYNKPTQHGVIFHFDAIRRACGIPVILYDVPSRTGCALTDETVIGLAAMPGIIGLKDATGDAGRPARLRRHVGDEFRLLSGDDATAMGYIASGGDGCISVTSNAAPGLAREMYLAFRQGRITRMRQLSLPFTRLTTALSREVNPAPVKYAIAALLGLVSPAVRLPLVETTSETQKAISEAIGYLDKYYPDYLLDAPASSEQRDAS